MSEQPQPNLSAALTDSEDWVYVADRTRPGLLGNGSRDRTLRRGHPSVRKLDQFVPARLRPRMAAIRSSLETSPYSAHRVITDQLTVLADAMRVGGTLEARDLPADSAMINDGDIVGLTWSRAMPAMAAGLTHLPHCTVVQLAGAIYPPDGLPGSVEIVRQVAIAADGDAHSLYAPLVVPDTPTATGLQRQTEIAATLARVDRLDVAVLSIGAWQPSASAVFDLLTEDDREEISQLGVCAEVSGRVINTDGQFVESPLDDRIIGATAAQLLAVPRLLTSASGAHRCEATKAAIKAGLMHTLVIDDRLARALLE